MASITLALKTIAAAVSGTVFRSTLISDATIIETSINTLDDQVTALQNDAPVPAWSAVGTYAIGSVVYSPIDFKNYRNKTGVTGTDPSGDATNWQLVSSLFVQKTALTGSADIPVGTTAQRDASPATGYTRFNSDYGKPEVYNGTSWSGLGGADGSGGDAVFYLNDNSIDFPFTLAAGKNAHSVGAVTINAAVTLNGRWVIS